MDADDDNPRKIKDYYDEWLRRHNAENGLVPSVVQGQANAAWQVEGYDVLKAKSPTMAREVNADLQNELIRLRTALPLPPVYKPTIALSTSSSTAQGNTQVVMALISARQNTEADAEINRTIDAYTALQARQNKPLEVRQRVNQLFPNLNGLLESAVASYESAKANKALEQNAALAMRNFLEKFKGELMDKARKFRNENDPSWETIAERLGGSEWRALANERLTHVRLHDLLSKIQKGWPASQSLADIWPQFLDHLFAVTGYALAAAHGG